MIVKVIMDLKIQRKLCGFKCIVQKKIGIKNKLKRTERELDKKHQDRKKEFNE